MTGVAQLADHPTRAFKVQTIVFREHTRDTSVKLAKGERLFVIVDGKPPIDTGYSGRDDVHIFTKAFGTWPVVAVKVREKHADVWRSLDAATSDRMMKRVRASVDEHLADARTPQMGETK